MKALHWFAVVGLAVLVGCAEHNHDHESEEPEAESYFQAEKGLLLPEEVQRHLNLRLVTPEQKAFGSNQVVLAVPQEAVIKAVDAAYVYLQQGDYLVGTAVTTGPSQDGWTQILKGVSADDRVVSHGAVDLRMIELLAIRGGSACCH